MILTLSKLLGHLKTLHTNRYIHLFCLIRPYRSTQPEGLQSVIMRHILYLLYLQNQSNCQISVVDL